METSAKSGKNVPGTLIVRVQSLPVRTSATRRYITFCCENIFPSGFSPSISETALYTIKLVLLLNFHFRRSDGTENEPGIKHVENILLNAKPHYRRLPGPIFSGVLTASVALRIDQKQCNSGGTQRSLSSQRSDDEAGPQNRRDLHTFVRSGPSPNGQSLPKMTHKSHFHDFQATRECIAGSDGTNF